MIENTINGVKHRWDIDHYMKVRQARGIESTTKYVLHPIVGKKFMYENGGDSKIVTIKSVNKQWWGGYFLAALYVDESGSSGLVYFENINCIADYIIEAIDSFKEEFKEILGV